MIDTNKEALKSISTLHHQVRSGTCIADFVHDEFPIPEVDGFLMVNSLHYGLGQTAFLEEMSKFVKEASNLLIVEYDTDEPVLTWVPYLVSYRSLTRLPERAGYQTTCKLRERASIYGINKLSMAPAARVDS